MATVIAVQGQKGGIGKTTLTISIATQLQENGNKVLVIDLDPQGDPTKFAEAVSPKKNIVQVLTGLCDAEDVIVHGQYFDIIPGTEKLSDPAKIFTGDEDVFLLSALCDCLSDSYDFIIVDTPPARNVCSNMATIASDYILLVTGAGTFDLDGMEKTIHDLNKYKNDERFKWSHAEIAGIVLNKTGVISSKDKACYEQCEEACKETQELNCGNPFLIRVRNADAVGSAQFYHLSLTDYCKEYKKKTEACEDLRRVAAEILKKTLKNA